MKAALATQLYSPGTYRASSFKAARGRLVVELPRVDWPEGHPLVVRLFHEGFPRPFLTWEPDGGEVMHKPRLEDRPDPRAPVEKRRLERDYLHHPLRTPTTIVIELKVKQALTTGVDWEIR